jgi:small-conductance mechanosensitive channel
MDWIQFQGPQHALVLFGIELVGVNATNGKKLLFSIALVALLFLVRAILHRAVSPLRGRLGQRTGFWVRQSTSIAVALLSVIGLLSIWFDDPARLTTAMGLVTAGLAFALQRAITALVGYVVILRGKVFRVGDRISMAGVRGDVIALGFMQTTIMEMGQPPSVQDADPAMWVKARQYSGRVVTVSNAQVFEEAIYNYTRDFPYLWEEMTVPISYHDDRLRAEQILLGAARKHTLRIATLGDDALRRLKEQYAVRDSDLEPRVYWRMTDNWLEMSVRFLVENDSIRMVKDAMTREILAALDDAKIGIASATFEIVGLPPLHVEAETGVPARVTAH